MCVERKCVCGVEVVWRRKVSRREGVRRERWDLLVCDEDGSTIIASVHLMCYKDHMTVT